MDWTGDVTVPDSPVTVTRDTATIVTANFALDQYTLTYDAGPGGAISGDTPQTVSHGGSGTAVTAVPDAAAGYQFVGWSDGVLTATRTDADVTADLSVTATFALGQYTLTYDAGPGGTVSGDTPQTVSHGGSGTAVTAVPDAAAGYRFVGWSDGVLTATRTDADVTADLSVTATFALDTFTITPSAGVNGSISPALAQTVDYGADLTFTITPDLGYLVADVLVDGISVGPVTSYAFTGVTADHTISASFAIAAFTITPSAGPHGSITPSTPQAVEYGQDKTFTIKPASGYYIADVLIDGVSTGPVSTYTFGAVAADHTISASFAPGVPTALEISVSKTVVPYGDSALLGGTLSTDGSGTVVGMGGRTVVVEHTLTPNDPLSWRTLATYTTSTATATLGQLVPALEITPSAPTSYRLRYAKESQSQYGGATSETKGLRVRPLLSRPVVPTAVRAGRWFTLYGSLRPHFAAGEKTVKVKVYRYKNRRWAYVKTLTATNVDNGAFTKYRLRTRFTAKGAYRFQARTTAATAPGWALATSSNSRRLVVR